MTHERSPRDPWVIPSSVRGESWSKRSQAEVGRAGQCLPLVSKNRENTCKYAASDRHPAPARCRSISFRAALACHLGAFGRWSLTYTFPSRCRTQAVWQCRPIPSNFHSARGRVRGCNQRCLSSYSRRLTRLSTRRRVARRLAHHPAARPVLPSMRLGWRPSSCHKSGASPRPSHRPSRCFEPGGPYRSVPPSAVYVPSAWGPSWLALGRNGPGSPLDPLDGPVVNDD